MVCFKLEPVSVSSHTFEPVSISGLAEFELFPVAAGIFRDTPETA
jgi:hypothetical protein